jgi:hypothetical protein
MVCYVNSSSATSPNTTDGLPARWIALIHQLQVAGEEGGLATMVVVFLPVLGVMAGCHISLSSSYVEKWYKTAVRPSLMPLLFGPHTRAPYHY